MNAYIDITLNYINYIATYKAFLFSADDSAGGHNDGKGCIYSEVSGYAVFIYDLNISLTF